MTPDLELYAFDGFEAWYKEEFGVELLGSIETETTKPVVTPISRLPLHEKVYKTEYLKSGNPNPAQKEVINKLASILVDMVIEEQSQK